MAGQGGQLGSSSAVPDRTVPSWPAVIRCFNAFFPGCGRATVTPTRHCEPGCCWQSTQTLPHHPVTARPEAVRLVTLAQKFCSYIGD